ncbi:MAG: D-glucuronyl C5-epimerase family protein [Solirubrobacteraceae bacterium]
MRRIATALAVLALGNLTAAPDATARPIPPKPADQVVLVLDHGVIHRRLDPVDPAYELPELRGPPPADRRAAHAAAAARPRTFSGELDRLLAAGLIDRPTRDRDRQVLLDARRSFGRITGTRRTELGAVLGNLDQIAAAGLLTPSRLPGLVLTLARNRVWWTTGPLLYDGQRVGFPGSQLVWQYYVGQGIEIQWLGTFGKANGYFLGGRSHDVQLGALLDEAVGLATQRAGGLAWEYDFRFDGGAPPWVSSIAQGTALQALGRAGVRFGRADYLAAGRSALGIFATPPPEGVRVATAAGAHYLIYSFVPGERVLNAFVQSLVGLYDYAGLANSPDARALFAAGEAEARLEVPRYDTGAWSLYDQSSESNLSYHTLVRDFLQRLCDRLRTAAPTPAYAIAGPSGGTAPVPPAPPPTAPRPNADVYCTTAAHFTAYMHQPPAVAVAPFGAERAGGPARLRLALSKISDVTLTARRDGQVVYRTTELLGHGSRTLVWHPAHPGRYRVSVAATDLAGNAAATAATVLVAPARKHR